MEIVIALLAFLLGAISTLVAELGVLNEVLSPVEGLATDLQTLLAPIFATG